MAELEEKQIKMLKIFPAVKDLEETIMEQKGLKCKKEHVLQIVRQLKDIKDPEQVMSTCRWIKSINSLKVEISPFELGVENEKMETKIKAVFRCAEELINDLNKVSSLLRFKFMGLDFIGEFVRNNGKCVINISWKFWLISSVIQRT